MFSYIFWYFQYLKIYCSHCRLGAASLMDSHIDSTSEKRKSANICQNMIYQIPPRLFHLKKKIIIAKLGMHDLASVQIEVKITRQLSGDGTLIYGMTWVSWIAMLSPLFYIFYTPIPLAIYKIAQRLYNDSISNKFLEQMVYTTHANRLTSLTFLSLTYHWLH